MRKTVLLALYMLFLLLITNAKLYSAANTSGYDTSRIYKAMAKARRGEPITIVGLGGSITQGFAATAENKRWLNLMNEWWKTKFPNSKVTLVNAGIGGTGSDIAAFRVQDEVLKHNPDFVVVEFSVNDAQGTWATKTMEGLIRQILADKSKTGVMMLMLKQSNGTTSQASHKIVGNHYKVPMVSFADLIDAKIAKDGVPISSLFSDGLHPVDIGMNYIAGFIKDELEKIYATLPSENALPEVSQELPVPVMSDMYAHTFKYNTSNLVPSTNSGWLINGSSWEADAVGSEMSFKIDGTSISIMYSQYFTKNRGKVEVWVDDMAHRTLDAYFNENWGPAIRLVNIAEGLAPGEHILRIKVIAEMNAGSTGHYFQLLNVLKAGDFKSSAPIARWDIGSRVLASSPIILDAGKSSDPDGDSIKTYMWSLNSKPNGSSASINNKSAKIASLLADVNGNYSVALTVNDGNYNSVEIIKLFYARANNKIPVAVSGNDGEVLRTKLYQLDGSKSSDQDGDSLMYQWKIVSQPQSSSPELNNAQTAKPTFKSTIEGQYHISLVVSDGYSNSIEDTLVINVVRSLTFLKKHNIINNLSVQPNPSNGNFSINYELNSLQDICVSVYSSEGKELRRFLKSNQQAGNYVVNSDQMDLGNYKGIYLIALKTDKVIVTTKLIVE